jgi:hypothetical protein
MFPSPRVDDHDGWVIAGWQPRAWQRSMRPPRLSQSHVAPTGSAIRARSFAVARALPAHTFVLPRSWSRPWSRDLLDGARWVSRGRTHWTRRPCWMIMSETG